MHIISPRLIGLALFLLLQTVFAREPQTPPPSGTQVIRARALGIPLHQDPQMAALLASLRLRQEVPATLYAAAAAVMACIYDAADAQH